MNNSNRTIRKFTLLFGDHAPIVLAVIHLASTVKSIDGPVLAGVELAIHELAAWADEEAGDGNNTMLTLAEQIIDLFHGDLKLVTVSKEEKSQIRRLICESEGEA